MSLLNETRAIYVKFQNHSLSIRTVHSIHSFFEFSAYPTIVAVKSHFFIFPLILYFSATYPILPNETRQLNQFLTIFPVQGSIAGLFWSTKKITFTSKPLQLIDYAHSFTCFFYLELFMNHNCHSSFTNERFFSAQLLYPGQPGAVYYN